MRAGDFVQLDAREQPFRDDVADWWEVVTVNDWGGMNVRMRGRRRFDVPVERIRNVGRWNPELERVCRVDR